MNAKVYNGRTAEELREDVRELFGTGNVHYKEFVNEAREYYWKPMADEPFVPFIQNLTEKEAKAFLEYALADLFTLQSDIGKALYQSEKQVSVLGKLGSFFNPRPASDKKDL